MLDCGLRRQESLPSWERGLKFKGLERRRAAEKVAPLVGAWIEIIIQTPKTDIPKTSLPSWERGLKYLVSIQPLTLVMSLPSWERGLKYVMVYPATRIQTSLPSWERGLKF